MKFARENYIAQFSNLKHNGLIKIVTWLYRIGKSYLLFYLYKQHHDYNLREIN